MKTTRLAWIPASALLALWFAGCGTNVSNVCELMCECEHCNDYEEDARCANLQWQADVADAYECNEQLDKLASCFEDNGTCDDKNATFSTNDRGSCSAKGETGLDCTPDPGVCSTFGNGATCEGGTCKYRACSGNGGQQPCETDGDCPVGDDRCQEEKEDLAQCEVDASDVNPFLQPTQPPQGSTGGEG